MPRKRIFKNDMHEEVFSNIVRSSFEGRRKMIRKSLCTYLNDNDYNNINVNPKLRAENLTVDDYLHISNYVCQI
jgi:16S rRNA (adenine1518-N6/adenine1519-N6)-dimethyltransferase